MQSNAQTVEQYLAELPPDRRAALTALRQLILANIYPAYQEGMGYGMAGYSVPHSVYPPGYHCNPKLPLPFAGFASQKNYMSLYLCGLYTQFDEGAATGAAHWFREAWAKTGKKLDMGKGCVRFKSLDDLALDVIAESFRRMPAKTFIAHYESSRAEHVPKTREEIKAMMAERAEKKSTRKA